MGLFVTDQGKRSDLQERLAAELREKAARTSDVETDLPDGVTDSHYVKNYEEASRHAWVWVVVAIVVVGVIIALAVLL
jgi:hypothetical protein